MPGETVTNGLLSDVPSECYPVLRGFKTDDRSSAVPYPPIIVVLGREESLCTR